MPKRKRLTRNGVSMKKTRLNTDDLLHKVSAYSSDLPLFKSLGLKPFKGLPTHKKHYLGKVNVDGSAVQVWVEGLSAQFWTFEIDVGSKKYEMTTGSGGLSDYWPIAKKIAEDMVVVKRKR